MSAQNLRPVGDPGVWVDTSEVVAVYLAKPDGRDEIRAVLAGGADVMVRRANELTADDVKAFVAELHPIHEPREGTR